MPDSHAFPALAAGHTAEPGVETVRVENVHVHYRVHEDAKRTLREVATAPWRPRRHRDVHALRGVSLTARAGEVIGVIGPNGSGKSTLMSVIAGLQPVTDGAVYVRSTPMLLGVGAVLNKSLSGRRNILLGGLALGMGRADILAREQDIIEFAEIGRAIDLPMRTYSSGMAARLQFAISAAVEPEVLIIDEALAVGDQGFREKSAQRIAELAEAAGTVFLVSHSMGSIRQMCTRVVWLEAGHIVMDGPPAAVIPKYRGPIAAKKRRRKRRLQRKRRQREQRLREIGAAPERASSDDADKPSDAAPPDTLRSDGPDDVVRQQRL